MDQRQQALHELLVWLVEQGDAAILSADLDDLRKKLSPVYDRVGAVELSTLMVGRGDLKALNLINKRKFIWMPPVTSPAQNAMLPVLGVHYENLSSPNPVLRAKVGLFFHEDAVSLATPRAIGLRFETPEGGSATGQHAHYHAQFMVTYDRAGVAGLLYTAPWLPASQPAFTLDAHNYVALMTCFLVSLYGGQYIDELKATSFARLIGPELVDCHFRH